MPKTKAISTVCSTKAMRHTLHALRLDFTRRLMKDLPELDAFGYGMAHLDNKADAIDPYRFHLVIEARRRVMEEYSTFAQIACLIAKVSANQDNQLTDCNIIRARRSIRMRRPQDWPAELIVSISRSRPFFNAHHVARRKDNAESSPRDQ